MRMSWLLNSVAAFAASTSSPERSADGEPDDSTDAELSFPGGNRARHDG